MGTVAFLAVILGLVLMLAVAQAVWELAGSRSSAYPDGRCYLCRRGRCWPGETCPKCQTEQP